MSDAIEYCDECATNVACHLERMCLKAQGSLAAPHGSVWGYRQQREQCWANGTLQPLTNDLYLGLSEISKQEADTHRLFWKAKTYRGMGHCAQRLTGLDSGTGICSLKRCKKLGNLKK